MPVVEEVWTGGAGLVYYGDVLLFSDSWTVNMVMDTIDVTNISIYPNPNPLLPVDADGKNGPQNLPFPQNQPDPQLPWKRKSNDNILRKAAQYGMGRLRLDGGLRLATITCSGLCATYDPDLEINYMPRMGNYVYMQFTNQTGFPNKTIFNFPIVLVKEVSFEFSVKNYQRWTMIAEATGEFDIFPGANPA